MKHLPSARLSWQLSINIYGFYTYRVMILLGRWWWSSNTEQKQEPNRDYNKRPNRVCRRENIGVDIWEEGINVVEIKETKFHRLREQESPKEGSQKGGKWCREKERAVQLEFRELREEEDGKESREEDRDPVKYVNGGNGFTRAVDWPN